jgi:hypothetical protein
MSSSVTPEATVQQLHLQKSTVKLPVTLTGASGGVVLDPRDSPEIASYLKSFRHVSLSGPFSLSISAGVSAKKSYSVDVAIIPAEYLSDPPTDKHAVAGVSDSGNVFLSNISPPSAISLSYPREFITLQLKPAPSDNSGLQLPLFVAGWLSEGVGATETAVCYIHCTCAVAGKAYYKTW